MPLSSNTNPEFSGAITMQGIKIIAGAGAPTLSAPKGSLYINTTATTTTTRLYINTTGSTTWTTFTTAA